MLADGPSSVPPSSHAVSEDEAQYLLEPRPARRTRRKRLASQVVPLSPPPPAQRIRRKRLASQVDSLSPPPPAHRRQYRNKPAPQIPTPIIPEPPLPAPTLPPRIIVRSDTNGAWWGCRHTCGSGEDCRHEQGWKLGSILGHEQAHSKHPQCSVSACPAHSILKRRDRPDRRGDLGRKYNRERRGRPRAEPSSLPSPPPLSGSSTPSTSASIPVLLAASSATSTTTAPIYPSPLPSQERHTILYVTEPSFEYPSFKVVQGEAGWHYTLLDPELFKNEKMVHSLRKMIFKGHRVEAVTKHRPEGSRIACYLYDYVSHMQLVLFSIDLPS